MPRPRMPSNLSESLHQRLNSYALAASAAGVGMLALAQPSEAKIVYTKANQQITPNTHYNLDLNNDGITDFTISNFYAKNTTTAYGSTFGRISIAIPSGNAAMGYKNKYWGPLASALPAGIKIQANRKFRAKRLAMAESWRDITSTNFKGPWVNVKNRYLGLRFAIAGGTHYGWARLNVSCANYQCNALLTGYAYETVANKGIVTGKTKGPDVITVEPASLGHLARGASAMKAWRTESVGVTH